MHNTRTIYTILILGFISLTDCGGMSGRQHPDNDSLLVEQQRLSHALFLDSTSLHALPDTLCDGTPLSRLSAQVWLLVDDATGRIISQKNADRRMYMASLTKMMTALLSLEHGNPLDTVLLSDDVCISGEARVKPGDGYLLGNLIYEMMLLSDNDAAYALAKQVGGDTLSFYGMMNAKAAYLHMDSTHFANPNGMPHADNYSSARDLMTLMRYALRDSSFATVVSTPEMDIPLLDGRHLPCNNTNQLLYTYEGCIGVKTGYTRQAGSCLASAARRHGVTLCLVLLNSRSRAARFSESAALLDYGFLMTP